jgi:hypothetical protein
VADAVDAVDTAVAPLVPSVSDDPLPAPKPGGAVSDALVAHPAPQSVSTPLGSALGSAVAGFAGVLPLAAGVASSPAGPLGGDPSAPSDPGRGLPAGGSAGASGGSGAPGGAAPSALATAGRFSLPGSVRSGLGGAAADDRVPGGPVADHDISPD